DAGVHAAGQVAHFDLARAWPVKALRDGGNFHLKPARVSVLYAAEAPEDFDARFSAIGRRYRYRILNRRGPPALDRGQVWFHGKPLDADAMAAAASRLIGRHDFTSFRSVQCQAKSPVKTLDRLDVTREGDEIRLDVAARSFLHNQVRIMTGALARVGVGAWTPDDVATALAARDRAAGGPTAPPEGLCLMAVVYPE
ncbi:MAG: tRNA pseudouridine synthase A, partial [Alphaproteobacteria bacterium]